MKWGDARLPDRFWTKCTPEPNTGCWLWDGATTGGGYGNLKYGGRYRPAHRVAYEALVGEVPLGLDLDHLCRVRCCVNPDHLEAVTRRENLRRGDNSYRGAWQLARTHCPSGHAYSVANTYRYKNRRSCKACKCGQTNE